MFAHCSPRRRPGVPLEVDGPLLLEEDIDVAVEARSFGGKGRQVVTELLACLHGAAWYVPPTDTVSLGLHCFAPNIA